MGFTIKHGLGIGSEKRGLRGRKMDLKNDPFRNPGILLKDLLELLFLIVYIPIRNFIRLFTAKPKSIRGKVCFVTGSGQGLGRQLCIALAKEGAIIACADVIEETNAETVRLLKDMGVKAKGYKLNVANKQEVDAIVRKVEADLGRVYLLVNNAAIVMPNPVMDEAFVRAVYNVNTMGPIWTAMAFLPKMKEAKEGHILNISSIAAFYGTAVISIYGSSKAALTSYFQALRMEIDLQGYENIFVTNVHPGIINTSEDYVDLVDSRFRISEMEEVVQVIINAILYNKTEVTNCPIISVLFAFVRLLPFEIIRKCVQVIDINAKVPTEEEFKNMLPGKLVQEGNIPQTTNPLIKDTKNL